MKQIAVIETVGSIQKVEKLCPIDGKVLPGTLVLRNEHPFPGFIYPLGEDHLRGKQLASIFIFLKYKYAPEKIIKLAQQIRMHLQMHCDAVYGEITLDAKTYPCIRVKKLQNLSDIQQLQSFVTTNGFQPFQGSVRGTTGLIKVFKAFKLLELSDSFYRDYFEREKFYIKSSIAIEWEQFSCITEKVKHQLDNQNFDAALGEIYRFDGHEKVIRIFDKDKSLERAQALAQIYTQEIKKELILG